MRRTTTIGCALSATLTLIACGGGGGSATSSTTAAQNQCDQDQGSETPIGADPQLEDIRLLAMDLAAQNICSRVRGRLMPIGGDGEDAAEGRMWIRGCEARVEDEQLVLNVNALLWSWVDRSSNAVGARFDVDQYVGLDADLEMRVIPQVRYRRDGERRAFVWLQPVREPTVEVQVLGNVDAEANSLWGEFVAFVAGVFGPSENERAVSQVREEGDRRLETRIDDGLTFGIDLCTSETAAELGHMTDMPTTEHPERGVPGPSTNMQVHPMGLDAAGPFSSEVQVEVTDGSPLRARLVCADTAHRMIDAFMEGGLDAVPEVEAVDEARIEDGNRVTLSADEDPGCDLVLVTNVVDVGEASSTFSYAEEDSPPVALVAGCSTDQQPTAEGSGEGSDEGAQARAER